jgi:hypothetical protein
VTRLEETGLWLRVSELYQKVLNEFITIKLLDFVHHPDFYKQKTQRKIWGYTTFRKLDLFPSLGEGGGTYSTEKQKACLSTGDARTEEGQPLETRGL